MRISTYSAEDSNAWDKFVARSESATFCHQSGWMSVIERTWGHRNYSLFTERSGKITGVLPLFLIRSRLFGTRLVSAPNAVYGGIIADDVESLAALMDAASGLSERLGVDYLELRQFGQLNCRIGTGDLLEQDLYVTFHRHITSDREELMRSFPRDIRRMIRKGIKSGLTAQIGRNEILNEFYDLYALNMRNLGTPVFPKRLFSEFLNEFTENCDILMIRHDKTAAGAVMNFYFRNIVMPYFGAANPEFFRYGISNFMYWQLMLSASDRGYQRFDFGRSKRGSGAFEFKRGWGMEPQELPYKYLLVNARRMPNLNPSNPIFKLVINFWKMMPVSLTKQIGPSIVRSLL